MKLNKNTSGFTLVEVMIVVAILGILVAIAYPSYVQQMQRSGRSDARVEITEAAQRLQRCFTTTSSYAPAAGLCSVADQLRGPGITSQEGFYLVTGVLTPTTYTITATAVAGLRQINDVDCRTFTLDQTGVRTARDSGNVDNTAECW